MFSLKQCIDEVASRQSGNDPVPLILYDGKDPTAKEKISRAEKISQRGSIFVRTCTITHTPSFLDYIKAGAQVKFFPCNLSLLSFSYLVVADATHGCCGFHAL